MNEVIMYRMLFVAERWDAIQNTVHLLQCAAFDIGSAPLHLLACPDSHRPAYPTMGLGIAILLDPPRIHYSTKRRPAEYPLFISSFPFPFPFIFRYHQLHL